MLFRSEKAVKIIIPLKRIMVLTGAGISVASGLPTYRGKDGLWTQSSYCKNPRLFSTKSYFDMSPYECWQHSYILYNLIISRRPNICHHSILEFQKKCLASNIDFTLVTQNIDGYHADLIKKGKLYDEKEVLEGDPIFGFTKGVYEIHGNMHYMRCSLDECSNYHLYKVPEVYNEYEVPRCKKCDSVMRRNILMFDEIYNEKYCRSETVLKKASESDLLIIAGTELKTGLPEKILNEHIRRNVNIIEFNLKSWLPSYSKQVVIEGPCEQTIPIFVAKYLAAIK